MDIGYSNLLGEHIAASAIEYKDAEAFQIVCPQCREPVFKKVRGDGVGATHFLSHYEAARAYAAECELRVANMNRETIATKDGVSRNQRLVYFLGVLDEMMAEKVPTREPHNARFLRLLTRHKEIRPLRATAHATFKPHDPHELMRIRTNFLRDKLDEVGHPLELGFAAETHARIAGDMLATLMTPAARPAFDRLFDYAWLAFLVQKKVEYETGLLPENQRRVFEAMTVIPDTSRGKALAVMDTLRQTPSQRQQGANLYHELLDITVGLSTALLVHLDYFGWLKKRTASPA